MIYLQFDDVHLRRDNPNVPSDLEQMPHLLKFLKGNGTVLNKHYTVLMEGERPIAHIAQDLGIHPEALRKRVRRAEIDASKREGLSTTERDELKRLRKENFELRRSNEILKSASLFFARELDPDRPK